MNKINNLNKKYAFQESKSISKQFLENYYYLGNTDIFLLGSLDKKVSYDEVGGCVFTEKELENIKKFMIENGDSSFYLIELESIESTPLNFEFPVSITWDDLNEGGGISYEIFRPIRKYLIITDKKNWFRVIDNDSIVPSQITYADSSSILEKLKKT